MVWVCPVGGCPSTGVVSLVVGRWADGDSWPGGEPDGLGALALQVGQGEVDAFDLAEPAFFAGALAPLVEVGFDDVQARQRFWQRMHECSC